jgi:hypothetical protein
MAAPGDAVLPLVYWRHPSTPYGPLFTLASYSIGSASLPLAVWTMKAVEGLAALASVGLVWHAAQRFGRSPKVAVALLGANPLLLLFAVGGAHNDVAAMAVVLVALALLAARREASAGAALVAAAAVKLTGGLLLPFALLGSRRGTTRLVTAFAVTAAVVTALTLAVFGSHVFDTVAAIGTGRQFNADYSGPDLLGRLLGTGITTPVRIVCALGGGIVLAASLRATLRGGDWLAAAGWTAFAAILIVPSFVPWYIAWLLPLSALARSRRLAATTVALTAAVALTHLPLLGFPSYV